MTISKCIPFHRCSVAPSACLAAALGLLLGCAPQADKDNESVNSGVDELDPIPETGGEPGTFGVVFEHNGVEREAIVYVPESYDAAASTALMLNFHGYGGTSSSQMDWADMRGFADRDGHIVVYPQGTLMDGAPHWNAALPGGDNKSEADDLNYIPELLALIAETYPHDPQRVYASGYSNGGMMAAALACFRSDLIASFGIVSGSQLDVGDICAPTHPTAVITLHGTNDSVLSYNGGDGVTSAQAAIDFWVAHNQTNATPTVDSDGDIERSVYSGGTNGVSVEHYRYNGGEHVWFSDEFNGANASELVWDFTTRHNIQGAL